MNNKTIKYLSMGIGYSVGVIGILFTLIALTNTGDEEGAKASLDFDLNVFFWAVYLGIIFCAVFALGAGLFAAAKNPKGAIGSIGGIIALVVVFGISYAIATDYVSWVGKPEEIAAFNEQYSSGTRKFSGMAVNSMWILLLLGIGSLAGMEVFRILKSKRQ